MTSRASVDDVRSELAEVLARFRVGRTRAFSFGDGVPEAVMLTYDEFEDLGGEGKFSVADEVLEPRVLAERLAGGVGGVPGRGGAPLGWGGDGGTEEGVISSAA